jgi:hypothetical protein
MIFGCSSAPELPADQSLDALSTCIFKITENTYDGPNWWGTIQFENLGPGSSSGFAVSFDVPSGVHCDYADSGWKYTQAGQTCRYTRPGTTLLAGHMITLNYSTDSSSTSFTHATSVAVSDSTCVGATDAGASRDGAAEAGHPAEAGGSRDSSLDATDAGPTSDARADGAASACAKYLTGAGPASQWVYADAGGKLAYKKLSARGDRVLDFSHAGYMGGGVALPTVPVKQTVSPSGADDTGAIAGAIAAVSALPLTNGFRGAVLLKPGTFNVSGSLSIAASGVVLRGSGSGSGGTTVNVTGTPRTLMTISGSGSPLIDSTATTTITDSYVPSGAISFSVSSASGFAVGESVMIARPVTSSWVHFMGMDTLGATWLAPGVTTSWERTITGLSGDQVTVDAPLTDSLDAQYVQPPGATMSKYTFAGRISQVGLEGLRFVIAQPRSAATNSFFFLRMNAVEDGWVKDVEAHNFPDGLWLESNIRRFTVVDTRMTHDPTTYYTTEAPFDFFLRGSEVLIDRSSSSGGNKIWYLATQNQETGPNVALNFAGSGTNSHVTAHQKWGTGLLVDNANVVGGTLLGNNGTLGSAEGWAMGWGVAWNTVSDVLVEQPPGAMNWAVGCTGKELSGISPAGIYESQNSPVAIKSLYLAQLCERLGPQATANIGY